MKKFKYLQAKIEVAHFSGLTISEVLTKRSELKKKQLLGIFDNQFDKFFNLYDKDGLSSKNQRIDDSCDLLPLNVNLFKIPYQGLRKYAFTFFRKIKPNNVPTIKIEHLLHEVFSRYKFAPYHNVAHGFSVTQLFNSFANKVKQQDIFSTKHLFACYVACLAHDIGHKGRGNGYMIASKNKLVSLTLGSSVLERYHINVIMKILNKSNSNVFENFSNEEQLEAKKTLMEGILSTDMSVHFDMMKKFNDFPKDAIKANDNFVTGFVIHACDIGKACLEYESYLAWGKLLLQEFNNQTISEAKNGLKVSEFMVYKGFEYVLNDQIGFASNLTRNLCYSDLHGDREQAEY